MKKIYLILTSIFLLGLIIRAWQLGELPRILNRDEAALAYNGFLISQTGYDEFNRYLPTTFESFGDYKLPGYPYTLAGLFKVLPAADWVVRLPSAIAGSILVVVTFWLARNFKFSPALALFAALAVAFNPIFIFYSRIAFEANVALTLLFLGVAVLTQPRPHRFADPLGLSLLFLATLFYNTPLLLIPILAIALIIWRGWRQPAAWLPVTVGLGAIFGLVFWQFSTLTARKSGITIFSDETLWNESVLFRQQFSGISQRLLGNRWVFYLTQLWPRFWGSFSPRFLVTTGGTHPWHNLPNWGHLFVSTYILGILGLVTIIKKSWSDQPARGWLILLIFSLAPSIITVDAPHATRSLAFIFIWVWAGLWWLRTLPKPQLAKLLPVLIGVLLIEAGIFSYRYFGQFPQAQPSSLQVGFDQIITRVEQNHPTTPVAIVDPGGYQYILTAWYLKIPPQAFFDSIIKQLPDKIGFKYGQQVTHYHFIAQPTDRSPTEQILLEWNGQLWQQL